MALANRPSRILGSNSGLRVSFEFFPPKTPVMEESLWRAIERLAPLAPAFVSVTYGAGGSTRERTHATVLRLLNETALRPAAHLPGSQLCPGRAFRRARRRLGAGVARPPVRWPR